MIIKPVICFSHTICKVERKKERVDILASELLNLISKLVLYFYSMVTIKELLSHSLHVLDPIIHMIRGGSLGWLHGSELYTVRKKNLNLSKYLLRC
jgi:hypothetical protein